MMIALLLTLTATAAAATGGAEPTAEARVEVESVALGERFHVFVDVLHRGDVKVNLPATVPLGDAFSVEGRETSSTDHGDGTVTTHFDLTVGAYDVGDLEVPAIEVTYVLDGTARAASTEPVPIRVDSVVAEGDEAELRPIAGPVQVMRADWTLIYVLGGLAALVALVAAVWMVRAMSRRRQVAAVEQQAARMPPDQEALARLEQLEKSGALDADDLDPAFTSLSEIVRAYLGRRFEFPALDLTTSEINAELAGRSDAEPIAAELRDWFATCDLVKFAEHPSSPDEARAALYEARKLVQKSTPQRETEPSGQDEPPDDAQEAANA